MENILQSIVKIIIIGSFFTSTNVGGNRQFLPPPLPYYHNDDYFHPSFVAPHQEPFQGFAPPHQDPLRVLYGQQNVPPPISYQNMNSFVPPQLFHQNENYHPAQFANPGVRYSVPQITPQFPINNPKPTNKPNPPQLYIPPLKNTNFKKPQVETPQKKPAFYSTNIIIKDEPQSSFYQDDYNKNYQEDDYSDSYSDDVPPPPEPCLLSNSPYRYFQSLKQKPNIPNIDKYTLCNPHFQPNFGNSVYTVRMPITLLPSRFPPRVEQLIERIQNYFSTYTQQETPKPQNETSLSTTVGPATEATSETGANTFTATIAATTVQQIKKNTTTEIEELSLEETNSEPTETTIVTTTARGNKQSTPKTIVVEVEVVDEETPDARLVKKPQQTTENIATSTVSVTDYSGVQTTDSTQKLYPTTQAQQQTNENEISNYKNQNVELSHLFNTQSPATEAHLGEVKSTAVTATENGAEDATTVTSTSDTLLEVTDKNG